MKRLLLALLLAGFSTMVNAQDFSLDVGSSSDPFGFGVPIFTTAGGGSFSFENDFPFTLTKLTFDTTIQAGLDETEGFGPDYFNNAQSKGLCSTGGFFLTCQDIYTDATGALAILFSGTNPADPLEEPSPCDPETNEHEGIPSTVGCSSPTGHFIINLNTVTDSGVNWDTVTGGAGTSFTVEEINGMAVPEPAPVSMIALGLLAIGGLARRKVLGRS